MAKVSMMIGHESILKMMADEGLDVSEEAGGIVRLGMKGHCWRFNINDDPWLTTAKAIKAAIEHERLKENEIGRKTSEAVVAQLTHKRYSEELTAQLDSARTEASSLRCALAAEKRKTARHAAEAAQFRGIIEDAVRKAKPRKPRAKPKE